jgi:hypothetical protein
VEAFVGEVEQDLPLTRRLPIYLNHPFGNIRVVGSVQDRIRVKRVERVLTGSKEEAEKEFKELGLVTFETRDRLELRVSRSRGKDLVSKMRTRVREKVRVDLELRIPYQSDLTLVIGEHAQVSVDQWRGGLTVLGKNADLQFSRIETGKPLLVHCSRCPISVRDSTVNGRLVSGGRAVTLTAVVSPVELSVDQGAEEVRVRQGRGVLSVHSTSGRLAVEGFNGTLHFHSDEGGVEVSQMTGVADLRTQSGQVMLDFDALKGALHVDTEKSDIQVSLPSSFEGGLDLMSLRGDVIVQFPYEPKKGLSQEIYGPASPGKLDARIGSEKGALIHAYSRQGGVRILRKGPIK